MGDIWHWVKSGYKYSYWFTYVQFCVSCNFYDCISKGPRSHYTAVSQPVFKAAISWSIEWCIVLFQYAACMYLIDFSCFSISIKWSWQESICILKYAYAMLDVLFLLCANLVTGHTLLSTSFLLSQHLEMISSQMQWQPKWCASCQKKLLINASIVSSFDVH